MFVAFIYQNNYTVSAGCFEDIFLQNENLDLDSTKGTFSTFSKDTFLQIGTK